MRAAPAFQVSLQRFGIWRAAVLSLGLVVVAAIGAWWLAREPAAGGAASIVAAGAGVAILGWAASLAAVPAQNLRWDGQHWHLARVASMPDEAAVGDLRVVIDLGTWMLLRFEHGTAGHRPRVAWLPVQRRGLEAHWHALRCSVYSPRPVPEAHTTRDSR